MAVGGYIRKMWRQPPARRRLTTSFVALATALVFASSAAGGTTSTDCANAVLRDWTKGTLGPGYALGCYDEALDALPEDLRAYTTAADDITRAAIRASRNAGGATTASVNERQLAEASAADEDLRSFPAEVVALAAILAVLLSCGLLATLLRRRRSR